MIYILIILELILTMTVLAGSMGSIYGESLVWAAGAVRALAIVLLTSLAWKNNNNPIVAAAPEPLAVIEQKK